MVKTCLSCAGCWVHKKKKKRQVNYRTTTNTAYIFQSDGERSVESGCGKTDAGQADGDSSLSSIAIPRSSVPSDVKGGRLEQHFLGDLAAKISGGNFASLAIFLILQAQ